MARKSSIDRLPEALRLAVHEHLEANRLTLDEVMDQLRAEFPDAKLPSRSALGRRRQRIDDILKRQRENREVMDLLLRNFDPNDNSQNIRVVISHLQMALQETTEDMAAGEAAEPKAIAAAALALKRLAETEEVTLKVQERIAREQRESDAEAAESAALEMGLTADRAAQIRKRVLNGQV